MLILLEKGLPGVSPNGNMSSLAETNQERNAKVKIEREQKMRHYPILDKGRTREKP